MGDKLLNAVYYWADMLTSLYYLCASNIITSTIIIAVLINITIGAIGKLKDMKK